MQRVNLPELAPLESGKKQDHSVSFLHLHPPRHIPAHSVAPNSLLEQLELSLLLLFIDPFYLLFLSPHRDSFQTSPLANPTDSLTLLSKR